MAVFSSFAIRLIPVGNGLIFAFGAKDEDVSPSRMHAKYELSHMMA